MWVRSSVIRVGSCIRVTTHLSSLILLWGSDRVNVSGRLADDVKGINRIVIRNLTDVTPCGFYTSNFEIGYRIFVFERSVFVLFLRFAVCMLVWPGPTVSQLRLKQH